MWRLTASNFGTIVKLTSRRNMPKFLSMLLSPGAIYAKSVSHGRHYEPIAKEKLGAVIGKDVEECGLFVSSEYPFFAATPDGLVGEDTLVEVKCPYSGRNEIITMDQKFPFLDKIDNELTVKKSHNYYDQIQGQLFIANRKCCLFSIYTFSSFVTLK